MYSDHTEVEAKSVLKQIIGRLNYSLQGNIYDYNFGDLKKFFHIWEENLCLMKADSSFQEHTGNYTLRNISGTILIKDK